MSWIYKNDTTKSLSDFDDPIEEEQFAQITKYTRKHTGGSRVEMFSYVAASKGKTERLSWIKEFLSDGKEDLYLRALVNLYRKLDFIDLYQAFEMGDMTEEEFNNELKENENQYLIPHPEEKPNFQQVMQIVDIMKKIRRVDKMTVDDVSEIFSLDMTDAEHVLDQEKQLLEA